MTCLDIFMTTYFLKKASFVDSKIRFLYSVTKSQNKQNYICLTFRAILSSLGISTVQYTEQISLIVLKIEVFLPLSDVGMAKSG